MCLSIYTDPLFSRLYWCINGQRERAQCASWLIDSLLQFIVSCVQRPPYSCQMGFFSPPSRCQAACEISVEFQLAINSKGVWLNAANHLGTERVGREEVTNVRKLRERRRTVLARRLQGVFVIAKWYISRHFGSRWLMAVDVFICLVHFLFSPALTIARQSVSQDPQLVIVECYHFWAYKLQTSSGHKHS